MKILIVDDDKNYTDTLQDILIEKGFQVLSLNFSRLVNNYIDDFKPEVVLTDLRMQISGFEIAYHVKQKCPDIKVFGITNYFDLDKAHWLVKLCDFDDVFNKQDIDLIIKRLEDIQCPQKK